ncbi:MAG: foldase protein PrsA [Thermodesulfobacteriota bacterium]
MTKISLCLIIVLTAVAVFNLNAAAREQVDRVVVVINDTIVTLTEFEEEAKINGVNLEEPGSDYKFLEQIIDKTVIEQEAKKAGIVVTDAEVEQTLKELKSQYKLNENEMEKALKKQNLTEAGFRNQWKFQLLTQKLIQAKVKGNVAVTDQEVEEHYKQTYGDDLNNGGGSEYRIAHILILNDSSAAKQKATEIADKAKAGEDFSTLAKEYSQDTMSAASGGDLGYFNKGDLVESLEFAIQDIKVNEIVGPVESPGGYHIIKVLDRKDSKSGMSQQYSNEIRANLYNKKAEEMLKEYLANIKDEAFIERKL